MEFLRLVLKFITNFLSVGNQGDNNLKVGIKHTTVAATILGAVQILAMNGIYFPIGEGRAQTTRINSVEKELTDLRVLIAARLQDHSLQFEELKELIKSQNKPASISFKRMDNNSKTN